MPTLTEIDPMRAHTVADAYKMGYDETYPRYHIMEIADAIKNWKDAQKDHGHTSFWGTNNIRKMRAYWLGRARGFRNREVK